MSDPQQTVGAVPGMEMETGSAEWEQEAAGYLVISRGRRVFMTTRKHQNIH